VLRAEAGSRRVDDQHFSNVADEPVVPHDAPGKVAADPAPSRGQSRV